MAIGPKEQQMRDLREGRRGTMKEHAARSDAALKAAIKAVKAKPALTIEPVKGTVKVGDKVTYPDGHIGRIDAVVAPSTTESDDMRKTTKKPGNARKAVKAARTTAPKIDGKVDRSPLAVGTFIVAGGAGGVTMAKLEEAFGIKAHPMRSKIFAARHELGFTIDHRKDRDPAVYVGKPPKVKQTAAA